MTGAIVSNRLRKRYFANVMTKITIFVVVAVVILFFVRFFGLKIIASRCEILFFKQRRAILTS